MKSKKRTDFHVLRPADNAASPLLVGVCEMDEPQTAAADSAAIYTGTYLLEGTGSYTDWDGQEHPVGPGSFLHHFPHKPCRITRSQSSWRVMRVMLGTEVLQHLLALGIFSDYAGAPYIGVHGEMTRRFLALKHLLKTQTADRQQRFILSAAELLLRVKERGEETEVKTAERDAIQVALARLALDFRAEADLNALAAEANMSYPRFRQVFREMTGTSPGAYRTHARLTQSQLILRTKGATIADAAKALNYSDQFVFARQFAKHFGVTPKAYMLQVRPTTATPARGGQTTLGDNGSCR